MGVNLGYLKKHWQKFALIGIFLTSFLLMIFSGKTDSLTVDEKVHISAGYLHTWKGDYTFNTEHPPMLNDLAGLFAKLAKPNVPEIPANFNGGDQWEYGDMFFYLSGNNVDKILFWARFPFILLTLGLVYLVFLWARALFGKNAGLIAAALTAFSPNILAHGRVATTDIGVTFFFLLVCWFLRKYYLKPNLKTAALLGLGLGLIILAKFSGMFVLPVIFLGVVFSLLNQRVKILSAIYQIALIVIIPLVLVWGVYAFTTRGQIKEAPVTYQLSKTFHSKTISHEWSKWLVIPFDKFAQGTEILLDHNTSGHWSYLNGEVDYSGWWYYFPYTLLYKMTLVEIILFVASVFMFWKLRKTTNWQAPAGWFDYYLLLFPPLLFFVISMVGRIDIGIRHILPILPFMYIFISSLVLFKNNVFKKLLLTLIILQIAITFLAFPNYLTYFNQIAGGVKGGIKHLSDSNLDWNQNMKRFGIYAKENDIKKVYSLCWDEYSFSYQGVSAQTLPNNPVNGVAVICAQQMVVPPEGFDFSWVIKNPPDAVIGNAMYVWRFDKKNVK